MPDNNIPFISPFDAIRKVDEHSNEYWSARELYKILGYSRWEKFRDTIERARVACEEAKQVASDHFHLEVQMVKLGSGAKRKVEDIHLSRYACYLTLQNADPSGKPQVALAQNYFAVQTRRQELADQLAALPAGEDQRRLKLREDIKNLNKQLEAVAQNAGVITSKDFAIFHDHGYRGLYGGLGARDIHQRKDLKKGQKILDHMRSDELAYNSFRASLTRQKIERENITEKRKPNEAHHITGKRIREFIKEDGDTLPEDLPNPGKSIQQLQREEQRRIEHQQQPSLFDQNEE
jgi:DNA-damage-inducible protein D